MNKSSFFAASCFLILTGCVSPSAVDDFAKASAQAASLFPAVAMIPYNACVAIGENQQLAAVTDFDGKFASFDQTTIDCKAADDTSQRLQKTYSVLATYISTLDKLAGGNVPTYDTNLKKLTIPGLNTAQQTAVTGLIGVIADLVDKGYRQKEAAKVIERANKWVQDLSGMLKTQLPPFLSQYVSNDKEQLRTVYNVIFIFRVPGSAPLPPGDPLPPPTYTSPALVSKLFIEDTTQIQNMQNAIGAFEKIFDGIGKTHQTLYDNRNKLWDKAVIQATFQSVSDIEKQVSAVEAAFAPTPAKAATK